MDSLSFIVFLNVGCPWYTRWWVLIEGEGDLSIYHRLYFLLGFSKIGIQKRNLEEAVYFDFWEASSGPRCPGDAYYGACPASMGS